jgi:hypothetical protein
VAYRTPRRALRLAGLEGWLAERFRRHRGNADVVRQDLVREHGITVSLRTVERDVAAPGLEAGCPAGTTASTTVAELPNRPRTTGMGA